MPKSTSWGKVANWYNELLKAEGTYQKDLILPNLSRLMEIKKGELVLDLACGSGFFAREFHKAGAKVAGVDISAELIAMARRNAPVGIRFYKSLAHRLVFIPDQSLDKIALIFAIQNIKEANEVFRECARVLKPKGKLFTVMNHPAFRVPKSSSWGWDPDQKIQYRRIDRYLSEQKIEIEMHPGLNAKIRTVSFHRPLQFYFKSLSKAGFSVARLEEWNSHKKSEPGPRAEAENRARKEIPLFLAIEAILKCEL